MSSGQPEGADSTRREQRQQRMSRVGAILAAFMGLSSFFSVASNTRFETYHTLDVIRLVTAGAGFGVALVLLIHSFNSPGPRAEDEKKKGRGAS